MIKKLFLISLLMLLLLLVSCKSPFEPDEQNQFKPKDVLVTYNRDPAWIVFPAGNDDVTYAHYELFDPDTDRPLTELENIEEMFRIGACGMEKIAENRFQGYLKHVLIQKNSNQPRHSIYIRDLKLWDGVNYDSPNTPYGITIEGAYDLEIKNKKLFFRMR